MEKTIIKKALGGDDDDCGCGRTPDFEMESAERIGQWEECC